MAINKGSVYKEGNKYRQITTIDISAPAGSSELEYHVKLVVKEYEEFEDGIRILNDRNKSNQL